MGNSRHPPWFKFYPLDFTGDGIVEAMTTEEVGAYILLLCKAWHTSVPGGIPDDDLILSRWSRLPMKRWLACKPAVLRAFKLENGLWIQKRLAQEFAEQEASRNERAIAGEKGAQKRWHSHSSTNGKADGSANSSAIEEPLAKNSKSESEEEAEKKAASSAREHTPTREAVSDPTSPPAAADSLAVGKDENPDPPGETTASKLPIFLTRLSAEFPALDLLEEFRRARDKLGGQAPGEAYMRKWLAVELEKKPKPAPKYIKDFVPVGWLKFVQVKFPGIKFSKRWEMLTPKLQVEAQQHFIEQYIPPPELTTEKS